VQFGIERHQYKRHQLRQDAFIEVRRTAWRWRLRRLARQLELTLDARSPSGRGCEVVVGGTPRPLKMCEMSGLEAISAIRGEFPDTRIIVLTTSGADVQVVVRSRPRHTGTS
jgi:DNA-binding NarL/FixJ family response regulator